MLCRHGGWDGKKWLSDVYVLDTSNFFFSVVFGASFFHSSLLLKLLCFLLRCLKKAGRVFN